MKSRNPILYVEDDEVDAQMVKNAFEDLKIPNPLFLAEDGEKGLLALRERQKFSLILLDLNMPRMNGFEFLTAVKQAEDLRHIPVVILTSSVDEKERKRCFGLGAAGYLVKPVEYSRLIELIKTLHQYWTLSELPE
jgi:CheY-like chemotaxis protein